MIMIIQPPQLTRRRRSPLQIGQKKKDAHLFRLQRLLQTLESIISPQEVRFNIIQCQIRGNFISSALIQCVKSSEYTFFFCRKLFFAFCFSSFIQSNKKKVKARCIKQKSEGHGPASAGVGWGGWGVGGSQSPGSGSEESQQLPLALCLRHLTLVGGEEEEAVVGVVGGFLCHSTPSPSTSLPKHSSLALKLADSASFLSVLLKKRKERDDFRFNREEITD